MAFLNAFEVYLRTGLRGRPDVALKFNPWHDPNDGRFTFSPSGRNSGGTEAGGPGGGDRTSTAMARPLKARSVFRGSGGSFGGAGATSREVWPDPKLAQHRSQIPTRPRASPVTTVGHDRPRRVTKSLRLTRHTANSYHFDIDEKGRTHGVDGVLTLADAGRAPNTQREAGKPDRLADDDGGHFIAARFNGPRDEFNHFAQNANFNRGAYRTLENEWAKALQRGERVRVNITVQYIGRTRRPESLVVRYRLKHHWREQRFNNCRGGR